MKNVISKIFVILLITFFFCSCSSGAPAEIPTEPPAVTFHSQTETLYYPDSDVVYQTLELVFDSQDSLVKEYRWTYHENSVPAEFSVTKYAAGETPVYHQEKQYAGDGALTMTLYKKYDGNGQLAQQDEAYYWDGGNPYHVEKSTFSENGTLVKSESYSYHLAKIPAARETNTLDEEKGSRSIRSETYYEDGTPQSVRDGIFDAQSLELLEGRIEQYDQHGDLTEQEIVTWDEDSLTRETVIRVFSGGAEQSSSSSRTFYNRSGQILACEHTTYGANHRFLTSSVETYHYDEAGLPAQQQLRYYQQDGTPTEGHTYTYIRDSSGRLTALHHVQEYFPETVQSRTITEYVYDGQDRLTKETQTGFNAAGVQQFQQVKEFDRYGKLTAFTTLSRQGNRYSYTYTYGEDGMLASELLTTTYSYGKRIDYQETSYEYHDNHNPKLISVHKWSSYDEAVRPKAAPGDLGTTVVTAYDETGRKIS